MRLYIARHGQAVSKSEHPDRPLSDEGTTEVNRVASFLARAGIRTSRVIHSEKVRAAQTGAIFANVIGGRCLIEEVPGLNPNDDPQQIADLMNSSHADTLIAGHLPHLGRLISLLVSGNDDGAMISLSTGTVVCLERNQIGDSWYMAWMIDPALLG